MISVKFLTTPANCKLFFKKNYSTLFVTGDKAHKIPSILVPYLDCDKRFQEIEELKKNVKLRRLTLEVQEVYEKWRSLKSIEEQKAQLENERVKIRDIIKNLDKRAETSELDKLKIQGRVVRDNLKKVTRNLWEMQEKAIGQVLLLPTDLHPNTPDTTEKLLYTFGNLPPESSQSHLDIGRNSDILYYISPMCYFLFDSAAVCELNLLSYFSTLLKKEKFEQMSNSDFVRSIVIEGCGMNATDSESVFTLENEDDTEIADNRNRLHLVGSASLPAFCAYHAKTIISDDLPVRYFAVGRQYNPTSTNKLQRGLFQVCQASCVEVFILTSENTEHLEAEFDRTLTAVKTMYENLGCHFRIVLLPAHSIKPWESLRASIQMFSAHNRCYIEVGHLSLCNDYLSKRLLMYYEGPEKSKKFLQILSGTVLSVPKVLGCVLECCKISDLKCLLNI